MLRNPFIAGRPIKYGEPFCGREKELELLRREVSNSNLVVLHALRRYGKTSLLHQLAGELEANQWKILTIDMSVITGMSDLVALLDQKLAAFSSLSSRIKKFLAQIKLSVDVAVDPTSQLPSIGVGFKGDSGDSTALDLLSRLNLLAKFPDVTGTSLVAVFDEFQEIVFLTDNRESIYEKLFRSAFQERSYGFSAIFSGSKTTILRKLFSDRAKMFYRGVQSLELGPISEEAFRGFVIENFRSTLGAEIPESIPKVVHRFLEGHPYGLQKVMYLLWHLVLEQGNNPNWPECLAIALRELLEAEKSDFEKSWQELTPPQRKVFLGAALGCGDAPFSKKSLARMGLAQSTAYQTFNALEEKGKIVKIAGVSGNSYAVHDSIDRMCLQILGGQSIQDIIEPLVLAVS